MEGNNSDNGATHFSPMQKRIEKEEKKTRREEIGERRSLGYKKKKKIQTQICMRSVEMDEALHVSFYYFLSFFNINV